jgi:hypothetical protein
MEILLDVTEMGEIIEYFETNRWKSEDSLRIQLSRSNKKNSVIENRALRKINFITRFTNGLLIGLGAVCLNDVLRLTENFYLTQKK